jgi:hypothetical protein
MKILTSLGIASAVWALLLVNPVAAAPSPATTAAKPSTVHRAWRAEILSGTIVSVTPYMKMQNRELLVVKRADGTPFDMIVTPRTVIKSGKESVSLKDLRNYTDKTVSVKFIPEHRGDVAEWIHIGS